MGSVISTLCVCLEFWKSISKDKSVKNTIFNLLKMVKVENWTIQAKIHQYLVEIVAVLLNLDINSVYTHEQGLMDYSTGRCKIRMLEGRCV